MIPVFDIEVIHWKDPIAVGFFSGDEYYEFLRTSEEHDVIWEFLKFIGKEYKGIRLFAHNAANFDNRFILGCLHRHNQKVRFEGGMARLVWVETGVSFEDSYVLLGRGLAAVCDAFNVPRKLPWDHYSTVNPWEMESRLDAFRAYLERDCTSLSLALDSYCKILLNHFNITPASTLSLTAVKAFDKKFYPVRDISTNEDFEPFIRRATYGGRNEVYRTFGENIYLYDIRSMFTSCYDVPVPIGKMEWIKPDISKGTLAEAEVYVPENFQIGPLPYRNLGRLIFPVGKIPPSWWDTIELRFAEELGCRVKIIRQIRCDEEPILKNFGEFICRLRDESCSELGKIWKLFGLRLSGKFGQHRDRTEVKHITEIEDLTGYYPIDSSEVYHERVVRLSGNRSPYIKPAINMRIRSEARVRHLRYLLSVKDLYYCDTDSVYTNTELECGDNPGELQLVDYALRGYFIGCKFYGYINKVGILRQRTAGYKDFQLTEYDFKKLLNGEELLSAFEGISGWKEVLTKKEVDLVSRQRKVKNTPLSNRVTRGLDTLPIKLP